MDDILTRLAILYGTDKFGYHDYTPNYYHLFRHLEKKPVKILEIGVGGYADDDRGGQSLEAWRDFFEFGEVTGIDIQKKTMDLGPRVKILQGNQVDPDFLQELVAERGPFDIIIDDGSHRNEHVVESFRLLFPTLNPGGIYVAEDVQTSFHPRFGGSLSMEAPNSVGYFGEMMSRLNVDADDPLIRDCVAMERYHNMIAIHKRADDKDVRSGLTSARITDRDTNNTSVAVIGDKKLNLSGFPFKIKKAQRFSWSQIAQVGSADVVVCCLNGRESDSAHDEIDGLLSRLDDGSVLVVYSKDPAVSFAEDSSLMTKARHRFKMVDHVEIAVHFPEAEIDELAAQIYSMERYHDAVVFFKSPNSYPSNFAFDANNMQAKAALAYMGEVLEDATTEGGLIQYADLLTRYISRPAAKETLEKLVGLSASSRRFYLMAGALAQNEKRIDDAKQLFTQALDKFTLDPTFSVSLANIYVGLGDHQRAEEIIRASYEENPRARNVLALLSRICSRNGRMDEAIEFCKASINLFPRQARPQRMTILADLLTKAGKQDEAQNVLTRIDELRAAEAS